MWVPVRLAAVFFSIATLCSSDSSESGRPIEARGLLAELATFEIDTLVDVVLVFDSTASVSTSALTARLQDYLEALHPRDVLPTLADSVVVERARSFRRTRVRQKMLYRVHEAKKQLASRLRTAVEDSIEASGSDASSTPVRHSVVDSILKKDVQSTSSASYTIYVLNLGVEAGKYSYVADPGEIVPTARGNESQCGAASWIADSERYLWLDLAAGPVTLGPRLSGEGAVVVNSIPRFDARASDADLLSACASLAALIHRTVVHFVMSPLLLPVKSVGAGAALGAGAGTGDGNNAPKVVIPVVRICESDSCSFTSRSTWKRTEALLREMGGEGDVSVEHHLVAAHDSPGVTVAVLQAMRSTRLSPSGPVTSQHRFLDSEVLAQLFRASSPPYRARQGSNKGSAAPEVPVYVLDFDTDDALLFEGMKQTVAFDDMVLSIQTRAELALSDLSCGLRRQSSVMINPHDASCSTLHGLLRTVWGVQAAHQVWNPSTRRLDHDYFWGSSDCRLALSFAQRDSPAQTRLLTRMNELIAKLEHALRRFVVADVDLASALSRGQLHDADYFAKLVKYQLDRAGKYFALHSFGQASSYLEMMEVSLGNLTRVVEGVWFGAAKPVVECC